MIDDKMIAKVRAAHERLRLDVIGAVASDERMQASGLPEKWEAFEALLETAMAAPDALTQARALLQRARAVLWKMVPRHEADVVDAPTWKECDALAPAIDAFLAGLPVISAPRKWTEE